MMNAIGGGKFRFSPVNGTFIRNLSRDLPWRRAYNPPKRSPLKVRLLHEMLAFPLLEHLGVYAYLCFVDENQKDICMQEIIGSFIDSTLYYLSLEQFPVKFWLSQYMKAKKASSWYK